MQASNTNKHSLVARILLFVTLLLAILRVVLYVAAVSRNAFDALLWDTFDFIVYIIPVLSIGFMLLKCKAITSGSDYQRQLIIPSVLILTFYIVTLLVTIKGLAFYSESSFYNLTIWDYICLYVHNCGASFIAIVASVIVIVVCLIKKKKSIFPSLFMSVAATVILVDGISLMIRAAEIYAQQFGVIYVIFSGLSIVVNALVFLCFLVLMLPLKLENNDLSC